MVNNLPLKRKVAIPTKVGKGSSSATLSPSKIPCLTSSGIKRLRSVSLERLSCSEMAKAKRSSKDREGKAERERERE